MGQINSMDGMTKTTRRHIIMDVVDYFTNFDNIQFKIYLDSENGNNKKVVIPTTTIIVIISVEEETFPVHPTK